MIINLDPDDEGNEDLGTPKIPKSVPVTPSNHIGSTPQAATTPNNIDSSNVSYESPEYQKQVCYIVDVKYVIILFYGCTFYYDGIF